MEPNKRNTEEGRQNDQVNEQQPRKDIDRENENVAAAYEEASKDIDEDTDLSRSAAVDNFRTPSALAWDGTNLYIADPLNRRVVLYTPGDFPLPVTGVRNAASRDKSRSSR